MPLKSPIPSQGTLHGILDARGLQSLHSMSEWENLPPTVASVHRWQAQCNEESMERQPFSDITARLLLPENQAREIY